MGWPHTRDEAGNPTDQYLVDYILYQHGSGESASYLVKWRGARGLLRYQLTFLSVAPLSLAHGTSVNVNVIGNSRLDLQLLLSAFVSAGLLRELLVHHYLPISSASPTAEKKPRGGRRCSRTSVRSCVHLWFVVLCSTSGLERNWTNLGVYT